MRDKRSRGVTRRRGIIKCWGLGRGEGRECLFEIQLLLVALILFSCRTVIDVCSCVGVDSYLSVCIHLVSLVVCWRVRTFAGAQHARQLFEKSGHSFHSHSMNLPLLYFPR